MLFYLTANTIKAANDNISGLDAKFGGILCILHCIPNHIEENKSYEINGNMLRKELSFVFDKEPKTLFDNYKSSYIIFAKGWAKSFYSNFIRNKIDLLSCAVFFLRRASFDHELSKDEIIDYFINRYNLQDYKDLLFFDSNKFQIEYNHSDPEENQNVYYKQMGYNSNFKSVLFNGVIQKSASDLKAAGQIQTLYSGSSIQTCFLLSNEPLDQYYVMKNADTDESSELILIDRLDNAPAENILLYGVPGCGKSHTIKTQYCSDDDYMERAVFHPDYTYSDFVGQILPKVEDEKVTYQFTPGPFTRILKKAVDDTEHSYYLIVEEINRGNAPAIFGDIFQLLDRDDNGSSEYGISNEAVAEEVYGDENKKIKIPSNLYILATMNTSDQNVFTLDTAFKRRWSMKHIENNINECIFANHRICGTNITWLAFATKINDVIIDANTENLSNEDNRLGAYFVKEKELDDPELFGEKVLMYLWNDAFKYDHEKVFKPQYHTLDQLIAGFKVYKFGVFVDDIVFETVSTIEPNDTITENPTDSTNVPIEEYLNGKSSDLIVYYNTLRDKVKERISEMTEFTSGSKSYAKWGSENIKLKSFANVSFKKDKLIIGTQPPITEEYRSIGKEIPKDGHHTHYYEMVYKPENIDSIVEIIIESYNQLLKE